MVAGTKEGQKIPVQLIRKGKEKNIQVKIGKLPSDETVLAKSNKSTLGKWGLMLDDPDPRSVMPARPAGKTSRGPVVVGIQPGSPADRAGIQRGDIILEINRNQVETAKDAKEQISKTEDRKSLLLLVKRGRGNFFVGLTG